MMLACMIIALGLAAKNVTTQKQKKSLGSELCLAGILILLVTPLIERLDYFFSYSKKISANYTAPIGVKRHTKLRYGFNNRSHVTLCISNYSRLCSAVFNHSSCDAING